MRATVTVDLQAPSWIDPTYDLVYVFLSNRTYPSAENGKLISMNVRTEVHRVIMEQILLEEL